MKLQTLKNSLKCCTVRQSVIIIGILSVICVLAQAVAQTANSPTAAASIIVMPYLLFFNALPLFLMMCVIYSLTNRVWLAYLITAVPLFVLLTVNYFKVYFRAETLSVFDLALAGEAADIVGGYKLPIPFLPMIAFVILAAVFVFVFRNIGSGKAELKARVIIAAVCAALGAASALTIYNGSGFYSALPSFAGEFNDVATAANKGFVFTFLTHINRYNYSPPAGYGEDGLKNITGGVAPETAGAKPETPVNIIAVMSEAFFDMEDCPNIEWYDGLNPTPNLDRLRGDSLWGYISVPGFAGSTASTEFEFLTGINISLIDSAMPVVYKTHVTRTAYSLPRLLKNYGYETEAMHPGNEWFYGRKAVYPRLGFDKSTFKEGYDYTDADLVHNYVADYITSAKTNECYGEYLKSGGGGGYFSFTVTIQNHGPYADSKPDVVRFKKPDGISETEYNTLLNYANGLYDADALLGDVCSYCENVSEPTVVVFFGDHLPFFDSDGRCLTALGKDVMSDTAEARENKYLTPYIIHGNTAFDDYMKSRGKAVQNGRGDDISSSFLPARLLDYAGIEPSGYFKAVGDISRNIPVIHISGGVYPDNWTDAQKTAADDYRCLSYWALRGYEE